MTSFHVAPLPRTRAPNSSPSITALHHLAAPCFPSPAFAFLLPLGCSPTTFLQVLPGVPLFLDEGPLLILLLLPENLLTGRGDTVPVCSKKTLNMSKMKEWAVKVLSDSDRFKCLLRHTSLLSWEHPTVNHPWICHLIPTSCCTCKLRTYHALLEYLLHFMAVLEQSTIVLEAGSQSTSIPNILNVQKQEVEYWSHPGRNITNTFSRISPQNPIGIFLNNGGMTPYGKYNFYILKITPFKLHYI